MPAEAASPPCSWGPCALSFPTPCHPVLCQKLQQRPCSLHGTSSCDNPNCPQTLPHVAWGAHHPRCRSTGYRSKAGHLKKDGMAVGREGGTVTCGGWGGRGSGRVRMHLHPPDCFPATLCFQLLLDRPSVSRKAGILCIWGSVCVPCKPICHLALTRATSECPLLYSPQGALGGHWGVLAGESLCCGTGQHGVCLSGQGLLGSSHAP